MLEVETNKLSSRISLLRSAADSELAFALETLHAKMITVLHVLTLYRIWLFLMCLILATVQGCLVAICKPVVILDTEVYSVQFLGLT